MKLAWSVARSATCSAVMHTVAPSEAAPRSTVMVPFADSVHASLPCWLPSSTTTVSGTRFNHSSASVILGPAASSADGRSCSKNDAGSRGAGSAPSTRNRTSTVMQPTSPTALYSAPCRRGTTTAVPATTTVLDGRYALGPLLGRGGVADVHKADDR